MAKPNKNIDMTRIPFDRLGKRKMSENGNMKRIIPDTSIKSADMA
jgi:hypothetical protein